MEKNSKKKVQNNKNTKDIQKTKKKVEGKSQNNVKKSKNVEKKQGSKQSEKSISSSHIKGVKKQELENSNKKVEKGAQNKTKLKSNKNETKILRPTEEKTKRKIHLKNKYVIMLGILFCLIVFIFVMSISYAFFTSNVSGKEFIVYTGELAVNYSRKTDVISVNNAYPMSDIDGMNLNSHEFYIKNEGNIDARYQIRLELDDSIQNMLDIRYVKMSYQKNGGEYSKPILLSNLNSSLVFIKDVIIRPDSSDTYAIKFWVDLDASNDMQGKVFKARVVVDSIQNVDDGYIVDTAPIIYLNKGENGNQDIHLKTNELYNELGVERITDDQQIFTSDQVEVTYEYYDGSNIVSVGNVDTSKNGIYYVTYSVTDRSGNIGKKIRIVTVNSVEEIPSIALNGNVTLNLGVGDSYQENGVTVTQGNQVIPIGEVKTNKVGSYPIRYIVIDKNGNMNSVVRIVNVVVRVYGVKRLLTISSSEWERIDDAIGLVANAQVGTTPVRNDFDYIYPWNDIISYNYDTGTKEITAYYGEDNFTFTPTGNVEVLTKIPEFYYKRIQDGEYEYIYITKEAKEGFTKSEEFSVGRYTMSGDATRIHSRSGAKPFADHTITEFRTYARNLGEGFGQLDYHYFILQLLYLVEYADYDSQTKLGPGYTNSSHADTGPIISGGCNSLGMHSGSVDGTDNSSIIYRGIEDIFGNILQFLDGINIQDYQAYICYNQNQYETNKFDVCYQKIGYFNSNQNGTAYKLGYDSNHPLISFPIEVIGLSNVYIYDQYVSSSENRIVAIGGSFFTGNNAGMWNISANYIPSYAHTGISSRLLKTS